jgi:hypothetical protein
MLLLAVFMRKPPWFRKEYKIIVTPLIVTRLNLFPYSFTFSEILSFPSCPVGEERTKAFENLFQSLFALVQHKMQVKSIY